MRIVIGYSSVPNSQKETDNQVPFWQNDNYKETWESKGWAYTRYTNQLIEATPITWEDRCNI